MRAKIGKVTWLEEQEPNQTEPSPSIRSVDSSQERSTNTSSLGYSFLPALQCSPRSRTFERNARLPSIHNAHFTFVKGLPGPSVHCVGAVETDSAVLKQVQAIVQLTLLITSGNRASAVDLISSIIIFAQQPYPRAAFR